MLAGEPITCSLAVYRNTCILSFVVDFTVRLEVFILESIYVEE